MSKERRITIGILAHVDAGKTTLSEALLYKAGAIRKKRKTCMMRGKRFTAMGASLPWPIWKRTEEINSFVNRNNSRKTDNHSVTGIAGLKRITVTAY